MTLPSTCLPAEPTAAPSDLLAVCGSPAPSPGAAPSGTPFSSVLTQAAATPAPSAGVANNPVMYPGIYCRLPTGSPTVPATVPASGSGVLTAAVCTASEIVSEKPTTSAKSEDVSGDETDQVTMELVYQFVAGQWVPPPVLQVPLQMQASGDSPIQTNLPGQEQNVAQGTSAPAAPQERNAAAQIPLVPNQATLQDQPSAKNTTARVSPSLSPAAVPATLEVTAPKLAAPPASPAPSASDDALSIALEQPGTEQATVALAEGAGMYAPNRRFTSSRLAQNQAQEKFAASITPGRSEITSGVNPSTGVEEKKSLSVDTKSLTATPKNVGTSTANREIAMSYSSVNRSPSVDFSTTLSDGFQPNIPAETKVDAPLAAHAPRLVQEIRAIADRVSVIDRNSVEVRFDFNDTDRLSVRVEYRDGIVHTTFKTDSSQLRDVVAHEWQSQNSSSEQRSYRMADPVFSQTAADRQNSPGANDGSGRQRAFEQQAQHGAPSFGSSGRSVGSTTSVAAPAARSARPETSQHLHALA